MTYGDICDTVASLIKKYNESDPVRLCRQMGIIILYEPLGNSHDAIKGFFLASKRIRTITVNSDLPVIIQRIIIAHELGHAVLHHTKEICAFHDISVYDSSSIQEKEANLFAAELSLRDSDVFDALNQDVTFFAAAALLKVPMEILDFKFRMMKWKGYKMVEPPISSRSNFLRDMEVPDNADYYA